jgi:hypothetical protein
MQRKLPAYQLATAAGDVYLTELWSNGEVSMRRGSVHFARNLRDNSVYRDVVPHRWTAQFGFSDVLVRDAHISPFFDRDLPFNSLGDVINYAVVATGVHRLGPLAAVATSKQGSRTRKDASWLIREQLRTLRSNLHLFNAHYEAHTIDTLANTKNAQLEDFYATRSETGKRMLRDDPLAFVGKYHGKSLPQRSMDVFREFTVGELEEMGFSFRMHAVDPDDPFKF